MAVGTVYLNGIQLDIDPQEFAPMVGGRKRGVTLRIIDGTTVYQDRGFNVSDGIINFRGQLTSISTLRDLFALYADTGTVFPFIDFKGNLFNVIFTPGDISFSAQPIQGSNIGWTYEVKLSIVSVTTWLNSGGFPLPS